MWLLTVSTVLEELATAELFTVALDVTTGANRPEAVAPVTTEFSSGEDDKRRRRQLLLATTLPLLTPTVLRTTRPAVLMSPTGPRPPMTTTTTRPLVLRRATVPLPPPSMRLLLTLLPLMPTEPPQLMSTELPLTTALAPALEITTTMTDPRLPRSLTVLLLRNPTVG